MMMESSNGWLTTLTDLAIILFMVTAADLSHAEMPAAHEDSASQIVTSDQPMAIFRPQTGGASLPDWLEGQQEDARLRLTILVRYDAQGRQAAVDSGLLLARQAEAAGKPARLIIEEGEQNDVVVFQAYDTDPQTMARNLLINNHGTTQEDGP